MHPLAYRACAATMLKTSKVDAKRVAHAAASAALGRGEGQSGATRAAIAATDAFFDQVRAALDLDALLARIACAAGCSWCCHQVVGVSTAELALPVLTNAPVGMSAPATAGWPSIRTSPKLSASVAATRASE